MKTVHVTNAVGLVLGQDLTRVVPGEFKGVAFHKGHIIQPEDIPVLLSMGKDHIYIIEIGPEDVHENTAAHQLSLLTAGENIIQDDASEGKVNMRANTFGLLDIHVDKLLQINEMVGVALSTLHSGTLVQKNELVATAKIIPLTLPQSTLNQIEQLCTAEKIIKIRPLPEKKAGLVVTGNEVFYGRIKDKFEEVIKKKLSAFGSHLTKTIFVPDDANKISAAIQELSAENDVVFVTGGMSVDPDDVTPLAVRQTGANVIVYGTPVMPGAMFLLAYLEGTPILGIPACGMFSKITVLDVLLPKVLIGDEITSRFIASLGHGGLCRTCPEGCRYPNCSFCKM
ncbi:molybdopterin-binding protein [Pelosinus sp. sgz500959]|uniref:molybdopterin-binding protein n=1 Tax=Pelosinus sp. sgz500959 TaxID=3242472 RepID=UPI003670349F